MAVILTGCSSGGNKQTSNGPTTLYWWHSRGDAGEENLQAIAKQYTTAHPNIKIEVVTRDPRTYEEDVLQALAANQSVSNAPDIFSIDGEDLPKYAPQLAPAPDNLFNTSANKNENTGKSAPESVRGLYEDAVGKATILKDTSGADKLYGLPMSLDPLALYINKDAIKRSVESLKQSNKLSNAMSQEELTSITKKIQSPPKTWTELTDLVPYLTIKDGDQIVQSAIALGTGSNIERSYDILSSIMLQNGTSMTTSDMSSSAFNQAVGQATTSSMPGLRALNFYTQFSDPQSSLYTWNSQMPNSVEAFEQGQVAMIIHYSDLYRFIIAEAQSLKASIDIQPLPQVIDPSSPLATSDLKTMVKMQVEVASSAKGNTAKQRASWDFIKYLGSKQGSSSYLSHMKLPSALKGVTGSSKFIPVTTSKTWGDLWYKGHKSLEIDQIFIAMLDNTSSKKYPAKEALDQAAKDTSTILQAAKSKWSTNAK